MPTAERKYFSAILNFSNAGANDFSQLSNEVLTIPFTTAVSTPVCRDITVTAVPVVVKYALFWRILLECWREMSQ